MAQDGATNVGSATMNIITTKFTKFGVALVVLSLAAGCGSLAVKVDVLNPDYVTRGADQRVLLRQLENVIAQPPASFSQELDEIKDQHKEFYKELAQKIEARYVPPAVMTSSMADYVSDLKNSNKILDGFYGGQFGELRTLHEAIHTAFDELPKVERAEILGGLEPIDGILRGLLEERNARLGNVAKMFRDDTKTNLATRSIDDADREALQPTVQKTISELKSLTGGLTLTENAHASLVASADEKHWAPKFNETFARGTFGDVDIAVKLETLGDFTIKGVKFDPSAVAQVAAKTTTQALLIATQMAGVPISASQRSTQGGDAGAGLSRSSAELEALQSTVAMRQALLDDYRRALLDFGDAIVREESAIGNTSQAASARTAIAETFKQHRARMSMSEVPK